MREVQPCSTPVGGQTRAPTLEFVYQQALWHELHNRDRLNHTRDEGGWQEVAAEVTVVAQALTRLTARLQSTQASAMVTAGSSHAVSHTDDILQVQYLHQYSYGIAPFNNDHSMPADRCWQTAQQPGVHTECCKGSSQIAHAALQGDTAVPVRRSSPSLRTRSGENEYTLQLLMQSHTCEVASCGRPFNYLLSTLFVLHLLGDLELMSMPRKRKSWRSPDVDDSLLADCSANQVAFPARLAYMICGVYLHLPCSLMTEHTRFAVMHL